MQTLNKSISAIKIKESIISIYDRKIRRYKMIKSSYYIVHVILTAVKKKTQKTAYVLYHTYVQIYFYAEKM